MSKMWKNWFGVVLSSWVALLPFLRFPRSWKDIMYTLCGIILIVIFFMLANDKANADK